MPPVSQPLPQFIAADTHPYPPPINPLIMAHSVTQEELDDAVNRVNEGLDRMAAIIHRRSPELSKRYFEDFGGD